jgi:hypothetical protein
MLFWIGQQSTFGSAGHLLGNPDGPALIPTQLPTRRTRCAWRGRAQVWQASQQHRTITAFFDKRDDANAAIQRLVTAGVQRTQISMVEGSKHSSASKASDQNDTGFWDALKDLFLLDEDRHTYSEGLRRGGFLVTVRTPNSLYDRALAILDDKGTVDLEQRVATWRKEGWQHPGRRNRDAPLRPREIIPVIEEQLNVRKRAVSHGRVRVRRYIVEEPVQEHVDLREERVRVERRRSAYAS